MDEQNSLNEERVTLTQRRSGALPSSDKMARSKLTAVGQESMPAEGGSPAKVIIWVVIVVVLAVGAYLALRNVLKGPDNNSVTQTPTPTAAATLEEQLVSQEVLDDALASNLKAAAAFVLTDQTAGKASDAQYTIQNLQVQKYTSFTRMQFAVANNGDTAEAFPLVTASYNATNKLLTITFNSISNDDSGLGYYDTVNLDTSNISTLTHDGETTNKVEKYILKMKDNKGFVLQTFAENGQNLVVLDVKEQAQTSPITPAVTGTTAPAVTGTTTPAATVSPTGAADQTTTDLNGTQFSMGTQAINTGATGNNFPRFVKFTYSDSQQFFTWNENIDPKVTKDKYPNVSGQIQDNKLTVKVANYISANIPLTTVNLTSVRDVSKVDVSVTNHVVSYVFYLNKPMNYRLLFDQTNSVFRVEIKH